MFQTINKLFGLFMVVLYFAAGLFFLMGEDYLDMNSSFRITFGCIVIFYGAFRAYQIYLHFTSKNNEETKEN